MQFFSSTNHVTVALIFSFASLQQHVYITTSFTAVRQAHCYHRLHNHRDLEDKKRTRQLWQQSDSDSTVVAGTEDMSTKAGTGADTISNNTGASISFSLGNTVEEEKPMNYFQILAGNVVNCLTKSDLKRKGGGDGGGSTGWTSWVDDASSYQLKCCIDKLAISLPVSS